LTRVILQGQVLQVVRLGIDITESVDEMVERVDRLVELLLLNKYKCDVINDFNDVVFEFILLVHAGILLCMLIEILIFLLAVTP
jgi:hypothetical protein